MNPQEIGRPPQGNVHIRIGGIAIMHLTSGGQWQVAVLENTHAHSHNPAHIFTLRYFLPSATGVDGEKITVTDLPIFAGHLRHFELRNSEGNVASGTMWDSTWHSFSNVGDFTDFASEGVRLENSNQINLSLFRISGGIGYTAEPVMNGSTPVPYSIGDKEFPVLSQWAGIAMQCRPGSEMLITMKGGGGVRLPVPASGSLVIELDNHCGDESHKSPDFELYYRRSGGIIATEQEVEMHPGLSGKVACNAMMASKIYGDGELISTIESIY